MKKLILLLFLVSTTAFVSCGNDDDSVSIEIDESLIPGDWNLTALTVDNGKTTTVAQGQSTTVDYTTVGKDFTMETSFIDSTDPNTYTSSGGYTAVITQNFVGQETTQEQPITDFLGSGEWRVEGNMLITTTSGVEQAAQITALNSETMSLKIEINESLEISGASVTTTGTLNYTLTRQ
ncbi:hypothetical protein [Aquimarina litoralis]|uniref:hypothetical protein n=1 Tax=Aquimarina litoralis TaxID=584605 RepID=UPI001C591C55|nr:hypothetical protein [Aquimarina litoralis]MBW1294342.1 hypothetical protein [Aquimarina litoralis]